MTNFEFYKDELSKIVAAGKAIAIINSKPTECNDYILCDNCDRHNRCGDVGLIKWLLSEYEIREGIEELAELKEGEQK